jgi:hypothetical protein
MTDKRSKFGFWLGRNCHAVSRATAEHDQKILLAVPYLDGEGTLREKVVELKTVKELVDFMDYH